MSEILYEVSITVAPDIREDYLAWLREHTAQMLRFNGFLSAEAFINSENDCEIICQYRLRDQEAMNAYLAGPAKEMRADGERRFGGKFAASRRIAEKLEKQ